MRISDPFRALNDEWAAFSYHKSHNKDQEEAALAARARIVHTTTSASIRAAKNGALGAALGDKTAGQQ